LQKFEKSDGAQVKSHFFLSKSLITLSAAISLGTAASGQSFTTNGDAQLAQYIQVALERNPSIQQSFAQYRAALQRLPQVSALPDPILGLTQYLRSPETRVGPQTTVVSISQKFPWFGKLSDKEKVAAKEAAAIREQYEAEKAETVRQVKRAYYDLMYIDRATEITREDQTVLEHYEQLAEARYSQGVGLQQAVVKIQAEITRVRNRLDILNARRVDAEAALNNLLNRAPETPVARVPLRPRPQASIDLTELYQAGRDNRPEVKASLLQIEKNEKRIDLARKEYWPDFTVGAGFVNVLGRSDLAGQLMPPPDNGKNIYSASVGVNIPIHRRRYDAGVLEATEDLIAARHGYRGALNMVETAIRDVAFRIQTLQEQISLFEKVLLPQAEQALRSTEAAYSTGTLGVLDLLDSERVLLDVRLSLAQFYGDYMKSLAEMERAVGTAFPKVTP
jgi:cobalt-zinc-cadmium efflux system outer membrane protein